MTNTFNIIRFGKYLGYDLKSKWAENRTFLLAFALIPFIVFFVSAFFTGLYNAGSSAFSDFHIGHPGIAMRASVFVFSAIIFLILHPSRAYGFITEKAKGSQWIELPASRLEKFLSMMLICLVIAPLAFFCIYLLGDAIICLIDKQCGISIVSGWFSGKSDIINVDSKIAGHGVWFVVSGALQISSVFLLGALIFKKSKVTKTILTLFIISLVFSILTTIVMANTNLDAFGERIREWILNHAENVDFWFNFWNNVWLALVVIGCGIWSWFRVKNVQH